MTAKIQKMRYATLMIAYSGSEILTQYRDMGNTIPNKKLIQLIQIPFYRFLQPQIQRIANQCMPDRNFQ